MNIGPYTYKEFKQLAENFHGYAAPGLLIGGYMVEKAKSLLPEGTLFEAVVETAKCLPDAVQLLTLCSTGNMRVKIENLGRYALSLGDKYTGEGVRVSIDCEAMKNYPEIYSWFFKTKAKKDQDTKLLEEEIERAGDSILKYEYVTVKKSFLGHKHMDAIGICPLCSEAYPINDGPICRGCQGEAPYIVIRKKDKENCNQKISSPSSETVKNAKESNELPAGIKIVPLEEAVDKVVVHDMTRIEPNSFKGPEFKAGQRISVGDVCRLQQMGRFHVAIQDDDAQLEDSNVIHENIVAENFARRMSGKHISYDLPPKEGKIDLKADVSGVLTVDYKRLEQFNMVPDVMAASRQNGILVKEGSKIAGTRAIPLFLEKKYYNKALEILSDKALFSINPLRESNVGLLVTGTEVFQGIIEDKFIPIITAKVTALNSKVIASRIAPDDKEMMSRAILELREAGADLLITTGGLSVDPDDVTQSVLLENGLTNVLYGMPVLPGAMSLIGYIPEKGDLKAMQVIGVPACALFAKTTFFDLILPRVLANCEITRADLARMGEGGFCMACHTCTWPKCFFGK